MLRQFQEEIARLRAELAAAEAADAEASGGDGCSDVGPGASGGAAGLRRLSSMTPEEVRELRLNLAQIPPLIV